MRLTPPIQLRLKPKTYAELQEIAVGRNVSISTLIRERLELASFLQENFDSLREDLLTAGVLQAERPKRSSAGMDPEVQESVLLELLLCMRMIAGRQRQDEVQGTLEYAGHKVWTLSGR